MSFDLQLAGRRALVTGGTKGVGAAVVQALCDAGAQVVAAARSCRPTRIEGVHYVAADLSTAEGAQRCRRVGAASSSAASTSSSTCSAVRARRRRVRGAGRCASGRRS